MSSGLSDKPSRRDAAKFTATAIAFGGLLTSTARGQAPGPLSEARAITPHIETRSLDELHKLALAEGGDLLVYGGGDLPNGSAGTENAFNKRFPGMKLRILVDRSKYHSVRIDNQLALGKLACDVSHILTIHSFDRWKAEGHLMPYKPLGWQHVYPDFKDPDGAYTAITVFAFATVFNPGLISEASAPRDAPEFLDPKLKGRIVLSYPHDDDAMLYQFDRIVADYGWGYMDALLKQGVKWVRGSAPARVAVGKGEYTVTFTASSPLAAPANATARLLLPRRDSFLSWPQPAAIFKTTRRPNSARLYLSWLLAPEVQGATGRQWPVRSDVQATGGYGPITAYNSYPGRFRDFLADRARLERVRDQLEQYIGPMQGPNPTLVEGIFPKA